MRTVLINLPWKCKGYLFEDSASGEQCCVLNARLNYESNAKTYEHELRHSRNNDLHCGEEDVNVIEAYCHKGD